MDKKHSALSVIWFSMIIIATVTAAYTGRMENVTSAIFDSAKSAVTLAISLIGPMALWLGIMKVVEAGGLMKIIARSIRPVMIRLFPDVPEEHPAMSEIIAKDPDSFLSYLVSTIQGSTETTFYVLAVYFGSIGIKKTRYALAAGLLADAAGVLGSVFICRLLF